MIAPRALTTRSQSSLAVSPRLSSEGGVEWISEWNVWNGNVKENYGRKCLNGTEYCNIKDRAFGLLTFREHPLQCLRPLALEGKNAAR